ncbi:MAG TPA: hypothetical protein VFB42_10325 [Gaiellaceae bacterium]|nr:hypothetical protein [Gaiellaceae bacterium]
MATAALLLDPVSDGKHVILVMLIVGLVFLAVIGLGEWVHHAGERRRERKQRLRPY